MFESATPHGSLTVEEYLELEEGATVRHEYLGGSIYAMVGATKRHNRIAGNIYAALLSASRGGPCRVFIEGVKLRISEDDIFYYPDVMVACGSEEGDPLFEEEPCLVVEVTSPSTETTDRREKLLSYKKIPSLKSYLIVHQGEPRVERHWRDEEGVWWQADLVGEGRVSVPCPETELTLADIYEGL